METPNEGDHATTPAAADRERQGISNRETSAQEDMERKEHPPIADEEPQSRPHRAPSAGRQ